MSTPVVVVDGVVKDDGSLEVAEKLRIPAGPVQVTVVPMPDLPADDPFWQRMKNIWSSQRARGQLPRSVQQVEADRERMREEWDERMSRITEIQAEAEAIRADRGRGE
jgi:hypothetical protein